jgi:tRNA U38,U39,U40 pseudouridine synthase TruA
MAFIRNRSHERTFVEFHARFQTSKKKYYIFEAAFYEERKRKDEIKKDISK